jgi:hypothetical protein
VVAARAAGSVLVYSPAMLRVWVCVGTLSLGWSSIATAQPVKPAPVDDDHAIVFEIGGAEDWSRSEGFHPGGTFAFEVTPIEGWLELEFGVTAIHGDEGTEIPVDVLFKKPWCLSPAFEFMIGVGPELIRTTGRDAETFWGVSTVLDFMFWPRKNIGWYVEPGYELTFRDGTKHHSLAIAAGLLIGR